MQCAKSSQMVASKLHSNSCSNSKRFLSCDNPCMHKAMPEVMFERLTTLYNSPKPCSLQVKYEPLFKKVCCFYSWH